MSSSIQRAFHVLATICEADPPLRFSDIAEATGLPKSTVNRLLTTLVAENVIRLDPTDKRYRAGYALLTMARQTWDGLDIRAAADPEMRHLILTAEETVHLAVLDGTQIVYVDKRESPQTIRLFSAVGRRGPLHCTGVGKAILAFVETEQRNTIIDALELVGHTPNTRTTPAALKADLADIRARGCAYDREEHEPGIRCVAAPIFDFRGQPVAAISLTSVVSRMSDQRMVEEIEPLVRGASARISRTLGYVKDAVSTGAS